MKYAIVCKFMVLEQSQLIVSGSEDGIIYFWNVQNPIVEYKLKAFEGTFYFLNF